MPWEAIGAIAGLLSLFLFIIVEQQQIKDNLPLQTFSAAYKFVAICCVNGAIIGGIFGFWGFTIGLFLLGTVLSCFLWYIAIHMDRGSSEKLQIGLSVLSGIFVGIVLSALTYLFHIIFFPASGIVLFSVSIIGGLLFGIGITQNSDLSGYSLLMCIGAIVGLTNAISVNYWGVTVFVCVLNLLEAIVICALSFSLSRRKGRDKLVVSVFVGLLTGIFSTFVLYVTIIWLGVHQQNIMVITGTVAGTVAGAVPLLLLQSRTEKG